MTAANFEGQIDSPPIDLALSHLLFQKVDTAGEPVEYNRAPTTDLALGRGFDPVDLQSIKRPGLVFTPLRLDHGAPLATFEFLYVSTYESFSQELKIDTNVEASYLTTRISHARKHSFDRTFSSNSISVIVKVWADYGRWGLNPEADLTDAAKELLGTDPAEFARVYGTRYVATESRMNAVYAVITVHSVSSIVKQTLESTLSAGLGIGKLEGSAKTTFINELKSTSEQDRLSINAYAVGGKGTGGFKDLIISSIKRDADPLKAIAHSIASTISGMDESNAVPYSFLVADMRNFGLQHEPPIKWSPERAKALRALHDLHESVSYTLEILRGIKARTHPMFHLMTSRNYVDRDIATAESFVADVANRHLQCRTNPDGDSFAVPVKPWLAIDSDLKRLTPTPTMPFFGNYGREGESEAQPIRQEVLAIILNTSPARRQSVIDSFFPGNNGMGVMLQTSGFGLSVLELFDDLRGSRQTGGTWQSHVITYRGNPSVGFVLYSTATTKSLENTILAEIPTRRPVVIEGEKVVFDYRLWGRLTDKASRTFTFLLMKVGMVAVFTGNGASISSDVEYFPMDFVVYD